MGSLRRSPIGQRRPDTGAAAVEFALVLPALVLVLFGIVDFGRLLNTQITLTAAAREAARTAAVLGEDAAVEQLGTMADELGAGLGKPVIEACPVPPDSGASASVELTYTFSFITPVGAVAALGGPAGTVELTAAGVMPCL